MADLTITEANIKLNNDRCQLEAMTFGETITKGQPVYQSTTDRKWYKTDADVLATAKARGISVVGGVADETGVGIRRGQLQFGAILTLGVSYVCSTTSGKICPRADLGAGDYITELGTAISTSVMDVSIDVTDTTL